MNTGDKAEQLFKTINAVSSIRDKRYRNEILKRSELHLMKTICKMSNAGENVKMSDLAQRLAISPSMISQVLKSIEKKELAQRMHDQNDRRVVFVTLTEKGKLELQKVEEYLKNDLKNMIEFLGENDTNEFLRISQRMYDYHKSKEKVFDK